MKKNLTAAILGIVIIAVIAILYFSLNTQPNNTETTTLPLNDEDSEVSESATPDLQEEPIVEEVQPKEYVVEMLDFEFSPQDITIKKGDTVKWVNKGKGPHYVMTSSGLKILDSKTIKSGESFSYTFQEIGKHKYFSPIYQRMFGTVTVEK